jgi:hypothetical protein
MINMGPLKNIAYVGHFFIFNSIVCRLSMAEQDHEEQRKGMDAAK